MRSLPLIAQVCGSPYSDKNGHVCLVLSVAFEWPLDFAHMDRSCTADSHTSAACALTHGHARSKTPGMPVGAHFGSPSEGSTWCPALVCDGLTDAQG